MNPNRTNNYKPIYHLPRPDSPKNTINHVQSSKNLSLTMSIGANQSPKHFFPGQRKAEENPRAVENDAGSGIVNGKNEKLEMELKSISKENSYLR